MIMTLRTSSGGWNERCWRCLCHGWMQAALNSGKLLVWTKGFNVEGVIGKDVVQLLSGARVRTCMRW